MSASALAVSGGAKSRLAIVIAGVVMAVVVLLFAGPVGYIAMPALSGLLITVGVRTIKPGQIVTVLRTGRIQQMVLGVTFVLTMLIPLQFAVLIGVGTSMILYIVRQSTPISLVRLQIDDDDHVLDDVVPDVVPSATVLILEPVGSLFLAAAPAFEEMLPEVNHDSTDSVVILRLRGRDDVGATLIEVLTPMPANGSSPMANPAVDVPSPAPAPRRRRRLRHPPASHSGLSGTVRDPQDGQ